MTNSNLNEQLRPIIEQFTNQVLEVLTAGIQQGPTCLEDTPAPAPLAPPLAPKRTLPKECRVPGCPLPNKGPRNGFYCEYHRNLPDSVKAEIKAGNIPENLSMPKAANGQHPIAGYVILDV